MKLTSADIVKSVIMYAEPHVMQRFGYYEPELDPEDVDEDYIAASQDPKKWKRVSKSKVKTFLEKQGSTVDEMFGAYAMEWEWVDLIDDSILITDDCIVRHFVNEILSDGCDGVVVTDPKDEKILYIFWHAD